jgi:tetratricopeptide (TPR) repeat protein
MNKLLIFQLLILTFSCATPLTKDQAEESDRLHEKAQTIINNYEHDIKSLDEAETHLLKAIEINPTHAKANIALALVYRKRGYVIGHEFDEGALEKAKERLIVAHESDPISLRAFVDLIYLEILLGNLSEASSLLSTLEKSKVDGTPQMKDFNLGLLEALVFIRRNKTRKAIAIYEDLLLLQLSAEEIFKVHEGLGVAYLRVGKLTKARTQFLEATKRKPNSAWSWYNYALTFHRDKIYDEAIKYYTHAASIKSFDILSEKLSDVYVRKGNMFEMKKYNAQALKYYKLSIEADKENDVAFYYLGRLYCKMKKYDQCEKELNSSVELNPDNFRALARLGLLYSKTKKDKKRAFKFLTKTYQRIWKFPKNRTSPYFISTGRPLCTLLIKYKKDYLKAIEVGEEMETFLRKTKHSLKRTDYLGVSMCMGEAYYNQSKVEKSIKLSWKAARAFKKVLKMRPKHNTAQKRLSTIYANIRKYKRSGTD